MLPLDSQAKVNIFYRSIGSLVFKMLGVILPLLELDEFCSPSAPKLNTRVLGESNENSETYGIGSKSVWIKGLHTTGDIEFSSHTS